MTGTLACRRHRAALLDFVDRRERGPKTPAALDHLERCDRCEREMAEYALTIVALRRAGRELAAVPVPATSAMRIRTAPGRDRWSWRLQAGSMLTATAIAAVLIVPGLSSTRVDEVDPGSPVRVHTVEPWRSAEARLAALPDTPSYAAIQQSLPQRYPDGRIRPWKEVPRSDAIPRAVKPS